MRASGSVMWARVRNRFVVVCVAVAIAPACTTREPPQPVVTGPLVSTAVASSSPWRPLRRPPWYQRPRRRHRAWRGRGACRGITSLIENFRHYPIPLTAHLTAAASTLPHRQSSSPTLPRALLRLARGAAPDPRGAPCPHRPHAGLERGRDTAGL